MRATPFLPRGFSIWPPIALALSVLGAHPAHSQPALGIQVSSNPVSPDESVSITFSASGTAAAVDLYVGVLLPMGFSSMVGCASGDALLFLTPPTAIRCRSGNTAEFLRHAVNVPFGTTPSPIAIAVPPAVPPGPYVVFFAATSTGSLLDGTLGGGDLVALATTVVTVNAPADVVPASLLPGEYPDVGYRLLLRQTSPGIYEGGFANAPGSVESLSKCASIAARTIRPCEIGALIGGVMASTGCSTLAQGKSIEPGATVAVIPLLHDDHAQ